MQVNNVVCRCSKIDTNQKPKKTLDYRGNKAFIGVSSVTIFVARENLRDIFFNINFAEDLSRALTDYLNRDVKVCPRISNVQGSKTFNFERTGRKLKEFACELNTISKIEEVCICQEQNVFSPVPLDCIWNDETWESNFMGISLKTNRGKLTCKIQISKDKSNFVGSFIISDFGTVAQKFNQLLKAF